MSKGNTLKKYILKALMLLGAVAVVSVLYVLQSISLTKENSTRFVKIHSPSLQKQESNQVQNISRPRLASSIGQRAARTLNAFIPSVVSSDFSLPAVELVSQEHGDFSIALFNSSSGQNFEIEIFDLDMLDSIPKRIDKTKISYPKQMFKRNVEGDVRLLVVIDQSGLLSVEKVLSSTNDFFKECALVAAKNFVYEVPKRAGKAVKARFILPIPFRINK